MKTWFFMPSLGSAPGMLSQHQLLHGGRTTGRHSCDALAASDLVPEDLYLVTITNFVEEGCDVASKLGKSRVIGAIAGAGPPGSPNWGRTRGAGTSCQISEAWSCSVCRLGIRVFQPHGRRSVAQEQAQELLEHLPPTAFAPYAKMLGRIVRGALDWFPPKHGAAAYGAWWDVALPIHQRLPVFAESCPSSLAEGGANRRASGPLLQPLQDEGWQTCPECWAIFDGARAPRMRDTSLGDSPHGWQTHALRIRNLHFRERVFLPTLLPSACVLVCSQAGPHARPWLTACQVTPPPPWSHMPCSWRCASLSLPLRALAGMWCAGGRFRRPHTSMPQNRLVSMQGQDLGTGMGAGGQRSGTRMGNVLRILAHTIAPSVDPAARLRLDLVIYGATPLSKSAASAPRTRSSHGRCAAAGGPGHIGRGPVERVQCSKPLLPQHWAIRGWCPLAADAKRSKEKNTWRPWRQYRARGS